MSNRTKADLYQMLGEARMAPAPTATKTPVAMSAAQVADRIGVHTGKLNLGLIGNYRAEQHRRRAEGAMQRDLTSHRTSRATELLREKIDGEVEILRMHFKQDFNDRIAALAESAAASQTLVIRKLKAVESEARKYLFHDIKRELDELQQMLNDGVIDMTDFQNEAAFRVQSYEQLKQDFVLMFDSYRNVVQNAYQSPSR